MAKCKECLYYEVCTDFRRNICETDQKRFEEYKINSNGICDNFKNKVEYKQTKHGYWKKRTVYPMGYNCSECNNSETHKSPFCRLCGTQMDNTPQENER